MTQQSTSVTTLLGNRRLVVLVGEGGVGKTSLSAALAYGSACRGQSIAVLTIDPAPRLGDALGIATIDAEPRRVALPDTPRARRGSLTAMRLDSRSTFDRMIERHAPSPQVAATLLAHPLYRAVSQQLGGTESYMAFQRLHELVEAGDHDCLVVDTPPAANAAELLSAPERLTGLLDTGALSLLADPARLISRAGGVLARATLSFVLAAVERVTGTSLRSSVSEFASLLGELAGGLEGRARDIDALLRSPETAFVLVTRPRRRDVADALAFHRGLAAMGIRVEAFVVNRMTPAYEEPPADAAPQALPDRLVAAVRRMESDMQALRALEAGALESLREGLAGPDAVPVFVLAARDADIATLDDVGELAGQLERSAD